MSKKRSYSYKLNMEKWDIYTRDQLKTGRTIIRGEKLQDGDYHLVVHIWIRNSKGDHLIQKRAPHLKSFPNMWAFTGGAVVAGEESLESAIRETYEELGLMFEKDDLKHIHTITRIDSIVHVWQINTDCPSRDIPFNTAEVAEVCWKSCSEIKEMIKAGIFHQYHAQYMDLALS